MNCYVISLSSFLSYFCCNINSIFLSEASVSRAWCLSLMGMASISVEIDFLCKVRSSTICFSLSCSGVFACKASRWVVSQREQSSGQVCGKRCTNQWQFCSCLYFRYIEVAYKICYMVFDFSSACADYMSNTDIFPEQIAPVKLRSYAVF